MPPSPADYQVILPVAGCSRRIAHLTRDRPKCFLEIRGRRLIDYQLSDLSERGFKEVILVVGFCRDQILKEIGPSYKNLHIQYVVSEEYETTGHAWSLFLTRPAWERSMRPVFLVHGDLFLDPRLYDRVLAAPGDDLIPADERFEIRTQDEVSVRGKNGKILALDRGLKAPLPETVGELVGVHKFSSAFYGNYLRFLEKFFQEHGRNQGYETPLDLLIQKREGPVSYIKTGDIPWININYEEDLTRTQ